jgi:hypothetical protein
MNLLMIFGGISALVDSISRSIYYDHQRQMTVSFRAARMNRCAALLAWAYLGRFAFIPIA